MSWVCLLQLNVRCNWVAATLRVEQLLHNSRRWENNSTCQNLLETRSRQAAQWHIDIQSLEVWPKVQEKSNHWCDYCWGTSSWVRSVYIRGGCISSLSLLFITLGLLYIEWVQPLLAAKSCQLTGGQMPDMNPLNTARWQHVEHLCPSR